MFHVSHVAALDAHGDIMRLMSSWQIAVVQLCVGGLLRFRLPSHRCNLL